MGRSSHIQTLFIGPLVSLQMNKVVAVLANSKELAEPFCVPLGAGRQQPRKKYAQVVKFPTRK